MESPNPFGADAPSEDYVGLAFRGLACAIAIGATLNMVTLSTVRFLQAIQPPATKLDLDSGPAMVLLLIAFRQVPNLHRTRDRLGAGKALERISPRHAVRRPAPFAGDLVGDPPEPELGRLHVKLTRQCLLSSADGRKSSGFSGT